MAYALIIAVSRENGDRKYISYRDRYGLKKPVHDLLSASGIDLTWGGGFNELEQIQNYLPEYKIIVYDGLSSNRVLFSGNSLSNRKLYLLYYGGHYNVIKNLKGAMAKSYINNACDT